LGRSSKALAARQEVTLGKKRVEVGGFAEPAFFVLLEIGWAERMVNKHLDREESEITGRRSTF